MHLKYLTKSIRAIGPQYASKKENERPDDDHLQNGQAYGKRSLSVESKRGMFSQRQVTKIFEYKQQPCSSENSKLYLVTYQQYCRHSRLYYGSKQSITLEIQTIREKNN